MTHIAHMTHTTHILLSSLMLIAFSTSSAKDLGVHGHVYPIEEDDFIEVLKNRLNSLSDNDIEKIQLEMGSRYRASVNKPKPVSGLKEAKVHHMHYYDPSITTTESIRDHEGNIIVNKGESFNPLDYVTLSQSLVFIDGTNERHLQWAKTLSNPKIILTNGSPLELEESLKCPIYFDQSGVLVSKYQINQIPAVVCQEGRMLRIEELPIGEGSCF